MIGKDKQNNKNNESIQSIVTELLIITGKYFYYTGHTDYIQDMKRVLTHTTLYK